MKKLVKEHLYEAFTDNSDPVRDMGIGKPKSEIIDEIIEKARIILEPFLEQAKKRAYQLGYSDIYHYTIDDDNFNRKGNDKDYAMRKIIESAYIEIEKMLENYFTKGEEGRDTISGALVGSFVLGDGMASETVESMIDALE